MHSSVTVELIEEIRKRTREGEIRWRGVEMDADVYVPRSYVADAGDLALTLSSLGETALLVESASTGETLRWLRYSELPGDAEKEALNGLRKDVWEAASVDPKQRDRELLDMLREKKTA